MSKPAETYEVPPSGSSDAAGEPDFMTFYGVGSGRCAVAARSQLDQSQVEAVKSRLERSCLVKIVKIYSDTEGRVLRVSGYWEWRLTRRLLLRKIALEGLRELQLTRGDATIHHPLPGEHGEQFTEKRSFYLSPPPSHEEAIDMIAHHSLS